MPDDTTRRTVSVSDQNDIAIRSFPARHRMKEGDVPTFIEGAVRWRTLERTVAEARGKFADMPPDQLETVLDEAVAETRQAFDQKAS